MAPPQLAVSLVPVAGGVGFNVMAITANRFQFRKLVLQRPFYETFIISSRDFPRRQIVSPHLCRRGFCTATKTSHLLREWRRVPSDF
jgi:hypothetical protein